MVVSEKLPVVFQGMHSPDSGAARFRLGWLGCREARSASLAAQGAVDPVDRSLEPFLCVARPVAGERGARGEEESDHQKQEQSFHGNLFMRGQAEWMVR